MQLPNNDVLSVQNTNIKYDTLRLVQTGTILAFWGPYVIIFNKQKEKNKQKNFEKIR